MEWWGKKLRVASESSRVMSYAFRVYPNPYEYLLLNPAEKIIFTIPFLLLKIWSLLVQLIRQS